MIETISTSCYQLGLSLQEWPRLENGHFRDYFRISMTNSITVKLRKYFLSCFYHLYSSKDWLSGIPRSIIVICVKVSSISEVKEREDNMINNQGWAKRMGERVRFVNLAFLELDLHER